MTLVLDFFYIYKSRSQPYGWAGLVSIFFGRLPIFFGLGWSLMLYDYFRSFT
jgi:hypothetical protein